MANIKTALGLGDEEYITLVGLSAAGAAEIARFRFGTTLSDETVVSSSNIADLFAIEANCTPTVAVNGTAIEISLPNAQANSAIIISKLVSGVYEHNSATLLGVSTPAYTYNDAIETYPIGEARLLNGGNFNGGEGGGVAPAPETNPVITEVTLNGNIQTIGGSTESSSSESTLTVVVDKLPSSGTLALARFEGMSEGWVAKATYSTLSASVTIPANGAGKYGITLDGSHIQDAFTINNDGD